MDSYGDTLTDSVNVADRRRREVVIDDKVHSFEVDTAPHELGAYQNPNLTRPETLDDVVALHKIDIHVTLIKYKKKS